MWSPAVAYGAVMLGVLGHASSELVAVWSGVGGPEVSAWRFLLGGIGLVLLALATPGARDLWTPLKAEWARIVPLSLAGVAGAYLLFHWALDHATVIQVATMVSTIPIFVGLSNLAINRQPISGPKLLTGAAAVLGVALLITDGYLTRLMVEGDSFVGVLMALGCAALVAAFSVAIKPVIGRHGALRVTALAMAIGGVALWAVVGAVWGTWVNPAALFDRPPREAWSLLVIALWNTTITQWLWIGGLANAPDITKASYLFFLKPVIAALLAFVLLAQPVTWIQVVAIAVICGAVAVEYAWDRRKRARTAA